MASEKAFAGAALLGVVGGIRSMTPPAALAARGLLLRDSPARFAVLAAAAGEFAADKAPFAPPRTMPPALAGRIVSGAAPASRLAGPRGAALGAAAAAAGTFGSYHARKGITELGVPGTVVALAEDGVAVAFAALATRPDPQDEEPEGESRLR